MNKENKLSLTIDGKHYEWHQQYITGAEIKKLGNIPVENEVFLAIKKPWEDEPILDDTRVDLARPEVEHFYSKDKHFKVTLIVNLKEKPWIEKTINFEQVVILAYDNYNQRPEVVYTVTYDRGPHENKEGEMVKGDMVFVKNKMIFNVSRSDKS
jgi:hypothetical protein